MVQRKWAGKTERLQKRHCGPNALLCQIYKFPTPRVGGKSDLHNYRPEKKNTQPMAQFSSPPLPCSLYLCRSLSSCSLSLSFRHPSFISILSPTAAWWVITPHSDETSGVSVFFVGFFCIGVCLPVCVCTSYVCVYMVDVARMVWSEEGVVGDPTNLLLGKHHLFTQNLPPSTPRLE